MVKIKQDKRYSPAPCFSRGVGLCLCCDSGIITNLAQRRFAAALCALCPPKSKLRALLTDAFIIAYLPEDRIWIHIALMYYKPRRPTFIELYDDGASKWGRLRLNVRFKPTGEMNVMLDGRFFATFPLLAKKTLQIFQLCSLQRVVGDFTPSNNLLVEKIDSSLLTARGDSMEWWPGLPSILADIDAEKRRKAEYEAKRRAERAADPTRASAPKAAARGKKRSAQRKGPDQADPGPGVLQDSLEDEYAADGEAWDSPQDSDEAFWADGGLVDPCFDDVVDLDMSLAELMAAEPLEPSGPHEHPGLEDEGAAVDELFQSSDNGSGTPGRELGPLVASKNLPVAVQVAEESFGE